MTRVSPWILIFTAPGPPFKFSLVVRQPGFEYPGAVYHVLARGDGGKQIFVGKEDHELLLYWLERVCTSHGWRVPAWVLTGNHFHLLLETPEANPVSGMRMLQAFKLSKNRRGRESYLSWLEARATERGGAIDGEAMEALRRGQFLG